MYIIQLVSGRLDTKDNSESEVLNVGGISVDSCELVV